LRCATNLRSLGQALAIYVGQSGYYPLGDEFPPAGDHAVWPVRLWELLGRNRDVFFCPARPDHYRWPAPGESWPGFGRFSFSPDGEPWFGTFGGSKPFSYAYNVGGVDGSQFDRGIGGTRWPYPPNDWRYREVRATRVKAPAQMIAIADGPDTHGPPFGPDCFALGRQSGGVSLRPDAPAAPPRSPILTVPF